MINVLPAIESLNKLRDKTAEEFVRSIHLIEKLDDEVYTKTTTFGGSIGTHFRHNIDFADVFLSGTVNGKINYSQRDRDPEIEQNREYAIVQLERVINRLRELKPEILETNVAITSEIDETLCHFSSVSRELEFLHSHTVHHHALIVEKLKVLGIEVAADFGVAPSTLKFWSESKSKSANLLVAEMLENA